MANIPDMASVLASAAMTALVPLAVASTPRAHEPVLVVGPFWRGEAATMQIVTAADARILGRGRFDATMIVMPDKPDLVRRLYAAGALLVINGTLFRGCNSP